MSFKSSFDYSTTDELIIHLRAHAFRTAGGNPSDPNYDPETFSLENDAATELVRLQHWVTVLQEELKLADDHANYWRNRTLDAKRTKNASRP